MLIWDGTTICDETYYYFSLWAITSAEHYGLLPLVCYSSALSKVYEAYSMVYYPKNYFV
jgi:hypothetical protein